MKLRTEKDVIITEDLSDLDNQGMKSNFMAQMTCACQVEQSDIAPEIDMPGAFEEVFAVQSLGQ